MMASLVQHSLAVLLRNQDASGAFLASPNFPTYQYSWFRDGSFISYALDLAGCTQDADRFHLWCAKTVLRHADKIERCITSIENRQEIPEIPFSIAVSRLQGRRCPGTGAITSWMA